jgi:UDP-N-acetylglucosamine 2-epimerase (non-hydrolysing)
MMPDLSEIVFVVGTRPEIIKTAPVLRAVRDSNELSPYLIHTDQHYDSNMSGAFFESLNLDLPDEHLGVGSGTHAEQTAKGLISIGQILRSRDPAVVLAQGDTNAVLSTAIAASKLSTDFGHIEAGIRSFDRTMPEEVNRILADKVANLCFVPTSRGVKNLSAEGIKDGVYQTGNTVVDACLKHKSIGESASNILDRLGLVPQKYAVTTIHRASNTDDPDRLSTILTGLDGQEYPVIFPCHPRTQKVIDELGFEPTASLRFVEPLDYLNFLKLEANARLIVTDSGGIQEEASILEVPCLTVRPNTERPETIDAGVNRLIEPDEIKASMAELFVDDDQYGRMRGAPNLYGDGDSGERITRILEEQYANSQN